MIRIILVQCVWCTDEGFLIFLWLVKLHGDLESIHIAFMLGLAFQGSGCAGLLV